MKTIYFTVFISLLTLSGCENDSQDAMKLSQENLNATARRPIIGNDVTFSNPTIVTNKYFGPPAGKIYSYAGGEIGSNDIEVTWIQRRATTKLIMGVECIIQNDRVRVNNILKEDTDDWLAQDDKGNVWYFGEDVKNYDDAGNFLNNEGSWEFGVDGALPGFWMPYDLTMNRTYYQEYYKGYAEDRAQIIAVGKTVTIFLGTYEDCLVVKEFNRFEPGNYEVKYFAPGVGLIKEEGFEKNKLVEKVELVAIN